MSESQQLKDRIEVLEKALWDIQGDLDDGNIETAGIRVVESLKGASTECPAPR